MEPGRFTPHPGTFPAQRTEVIGSYDNYADAQAAVDSLADRGFPVERVAIVGSELRLVEQVTGRRGYGSAALEGAMSGAVMGALLGLFFGLFGLVDSRLSGLGLAFWGAIIGAVVGLAIGAIGHALWRGQRDFGSVAGMQAGRFEVVADIEVAEDARRLVAEGRVRRAA
ncbi:MAG: general stress protein [Candidatus Rokuibacteriota bacterium]